ncbi:MAG: hypothetical protein ACE5HI_07570, partial [bacterium]
VFKNFVTALWSVYHDTLSPGISFDPISQDVDEQLVRYIGNVINNDLGRVMREADYTMKKWAVGTEKPDIPGFKDVDELMASTGINYFGASRRFWFVPVAMRFRRNEDMLLFDSGRMTLKTEYIFQNKSVKAEPADKEFAKFFTTHYNEIAEKYPVYKELFEYAKLVSLAQYLKKSGVPMFWFLMANKDLVITEDSPGTVQQLVKGSKYFRGTQIIGGVDLDYNKGQYVYDQQAMDAINEAYSRLPTMSTSSTSIASSPKITRTVSQPFSFDMGKQSYTVLPQHSLTSGKDRRGIRYQTDLALRMEGEPGLELVRYFNPNKRDSGEFGEGWHLLIPYRIKPADNEKVRYQNVILPKRMAFENLLSGEKEVLEFSENRYSIVGYVPDSLKSSQVLGLFLMSDASYRLADKLGNEFHFDQAGYLTEMFLGSNYHVKYEYHDGFITDFKEVPYQLQQIDEERAEYANVTIPKRLVLKNILTDTSEVFVFRSKWGVAAYIPESGTKSTFRKMLLMTDGSFRLLDGKENEIAFDASGMFDGISPGPEHLRMICSVSQGSQVLNFKYTLDDENSVRISESYLIDDEGNSSPKFVAHYIYDNQRRLARVDKTAGLFAHK